MTTGEGFDSQVDSFMPLEIVIAIERLWALIALEGAIILLLLLARMVSIHLSAHLVCRVLHVHASNKSHLIPWAVHIGHDGT